jgi:hypothetical protein
MINRVSATGLSVRNYWNRYTEDALDLCDALATIIEEVTDDKSLPKYERRRKWPRRGTGVSCASMATIGGKCLASLLRAACVVVRAPIFTFQGGKVRDLWMLSDMHGVIERLRAR